MSWTLCTSGSAIARAGVNANSTIVASGSTLAGFSNEIEGGIYAQTFYDWVTNYASISTEGKKILDNAASAGIANEIIGYDPSGYTKLLEAQTIMDKNDAIYRKMVDLLNDINVRKKIGATS